MYSIFCCVIFRSEDVENRHLYENTNSEEPFYENCTVPVGEDDKEHIYEHVSCQSPVNIFLGLLQSETETISPDPNIYEVPPGAIFNTSLISVEEPDTKQVKPPEGFQDYENISWDEETNFDKELFTLPVEVVYSTVVKPKRKHRRPHISVMLHAENNASSKSAEGTSVEMSDATHIDNSNVSAFAVTKNAEKHTNSAICETSSERSSNHIQDCTNDTSSDCNIIDSKIDGSVASIGGNSVDIKVDNCVYPYEDESIETNTCGGKPIDTELDNSAASFGNKLDNTESDNCIASCGDNLIVRKADGTENRTEVCNSLNSHENSSVDNRADIFISSGGHSSNIIDVQDIITSHEDDYVGVCVSASEDNLVDTNVDKCSSSCGDPKIHTENIICGDSSKNGMIADVGISSSNKISDTMDGEFPNSTVRDEDSTGKDSETTINGISEYDCVNTEDKDCENAAVIEISEDGTWMTKILPPTELGQAKQEDDINSAEEPEFLCAVGRSAETVKMAYGSQYYVNCLASSVKPQKHEVSSDVDDDMARNIGTKIMQTHGEGRHKSHENLPDISLLDVDASLEDIQRERRRIIDNQAVRAKRIDSWIRSGELPGDIPDDLLEPENVLSSEGKTLELPSSTVTDVVVSVDSPGDVTKFSTPTIDMETFTNISTNKFPAEGKFNKFVLTSSVSTCLIRYSVKCPSIMFSVTCYAYLLYKLSSLKPCEFRSLSPRCVTSQGSLKEVYVDTSLHKVRLQY